MPPVSLTLSERSVCDLECLATGVYAPLNGFVGEVDYQHIVRELRLADGSVWSIPITLQVDGAQAEPIALDSEVTLRLPSGRAIGQLTVTSKYQPDREREAKEVFGTTDLAHPGVRALREAGEVYLGGPVKLGEPVPHEDFTEHRRTPAETRAEIARRGWRTVAAFQTRNPIHRAHEYLTKVALESTDGLLIHPLVGATKADDIPAGTRMRAYETLLAGYYPSDRVLLGVYPAAMRYGGPREAILHALSRRNYGCTHFIVGRDHAGVGSYYGPLDAQRIFDRFSEDELGIRILKFENAFWCRTCGAMASAKTCPHPESERLSLSGTRVRELLAKGEPLPEEFTRPAVARCLMGHEPVAGPLPAEGFAVWFTGLPAAGKTTLAEALARELRASGRSVELLDGDVVRTHLSKGLGFSKEDRDTNIRRIGFVAQLLARNGVIALCAAISPYRAVRDEVRSMIGSFVEVYVDAPLEVCEQRDPKGLYAKARAGTVKGVTGVDDPYEAPVNPEVVCRTSEETVEQSVARIMAAIRSRK